MSRVSPFVFLLLIEASIPSCTKGDNPLFSGAPLKGAMVPFRDMGPVRVCMAYHRIVGPQGELAGFCQKAASPQPRPCHSDADCNDREACVCGRCMVQYCTRSDECPEGMECDFSTSRCVIPCHDDCGCPGPNARCDIGMCQQMCISDNECQGGELCSLAMARCTTFSCHGDDECLEDEKCVIQQEPRIMREPTILHEGGKYYMWVEMDQGSRERRVIFRASSRDGLHWSMEPPAPVLESDAQDDFRVGAPSVVKIGSKYLMFFEIGDGRAIGLATSPDGRTWSRTGAPVLSPLADEGKIHAPGAVVHGSSVLLYYQVGDGTAIRVAVSQDGGSTFDPSSRRDVLVPSDVQYEGWREISAITSPYPVERDGAVYLWFSAHGYESGKAVALDGSVSQISANYSIGVAYSTDGINFVPYPNNPVFDRVVPNTFVTHASELSPAVLYAGGSYILLYNASDPDGVEDWGMGMALVKTR